MGRHLLGNKYDLTGEYGIGYFNNNIDKYFLFDLEDYELIKNHTWQCFCGRQSSYYVRDSAKNFLHNIIMHNNPDDSHMVDHINGDGLDNRKCNLRIVTKSQNAKNRKKYENNTSGYAGIQWRNDRQRWRVRIQVDNKMITVGHFKNLQEAINARMNAEDIYFQGLQRETYVDK